MKDRQYINPTLFLIGLFGLSLYFLLARLNVGTTFPFSDHLAFTTILRNDCSLTFVGAWTPPIRCLNALIGKVFEVPPLYLFVTLLLKATMFLGIALTFFMLHNSNNRTNSALVVSLFCLILITIGGGSRLFLGGGDLFVHSTIHSRQWAQIIILFVFVFFVTERYFRASLLLSIAIFIHPANSFHVAVILVLSLPLITPRNDLKRVLLAFVLPVLIALTLQYLAVYGLAGIPSFSDLAQILQPDTTQVGSYSTGQFFVNEWYAFIRNQDPDDLSLIWVLSHGRPYFYLPLILFGLIFGWLTEKPRSFNSFLSYPAIAITTVSLAYFVGCITVELLQSPNFLLQKLIVVQPRRALYIPIFFMYYYSVRATFDFFWYDTARHRKHYLTLLLFYSVYFLTMFSTNSNTDIPTFIFALSFIGIIILINLCYFSNSLQPIVTNTFEKTSLLLFIGVLMVFLKTSPHLTTSAYHKMDKLFFDWESRNFRNYLEISADLDSDQFQSDYLSTTVWITKNTPEAANFALAGLSELMVQDFRFLAPNRHSTSLNIYYARGGSHYLIEEYLKEKKYFEDTLGMQLENKPLTLSHSISILETFLTTSSKDKLNSLTNRGGDHFHYLLTTFQLPLQLAFSTNTLQLYFLNSTLSIEQP